MSGGGTVLVPQHGNETEAKPRRPVPLPRAHVYEVVPDNAIVVRRFKTLLDWCLIFVCVCMCLICACVCVLDLCVCVATAGAAAALPFPVKILVSEIAEEEEERQQV